jgi:hypothetical protein
MRMIRIHAASRALLDAARNRSTTLYVTSQILREFYSIVTNPRVWTSEVSSIRFKSALRLSDHTLLAELFEFVVAQTEHRAVDLAIVLS